MTFVHVVIYIIQTKINGAELLASIELKWHKGKFFFCVYQLAHFGKQIPPTFRPETNVF